jgi:FtsP/CotA-like multicopper oxidase with cupredoxin domain
MPGDSRILVCIFFVGIAPHPAGAQTPVCPARPSPGTVVTNPLDLFSSNGTLTAAFTLQSEVGSFLQECYTYQAASGPVEAPTLRLNPGDHLVLNLTNRLTYLPPPPPSRPAAAVASLVGNLNVPMCVVPRTVPNDSCTGGTAVATSTNVHFHGLSIPPVCHQDDTLTTDIQNTDPAFQYNFQVPANNPPGMYWYHPHLHGQATLQLNGGAAGALIVSGMQKVKPEVGGLPERVLIVRQQFKNPNSWIAGPNQLTLNYQQASSPMPLPVIQMQPGATEFWRVANMTSQGFLTLSVLFGQTAQNVEIIALDGVPVTTSYNVTAIVLPPAGRAEFIVTGPPAGVAASFSQMGFDTGPIGNPNNAQELAAVQATTSAIEPPALPAAPRRAASKAPQRFAGLLAQTPTAERKIFFAEATNGTNGPTEFFIAVDGTTPKVFSMTDAPAITTTVGAVEDWTVENRTGETHAFHIHQIHYLYLATSGVPEVNPQLRDTVVVPAWSGTGPYPNVTVRMDFRDPAIAGTFVFHCHVLDHEDAGMMAKIRVNPK